MESAIEVATVEEREPTAGEEAEAAAITVGIAKDTDEAPPQPPQEQGTYCEPTTAIKILKNLMCS